MRGPILNLSPGLGASGVDMEYRRNSQGTSLLSLVGWLVGLSLSRPFNFEFVCISKFFFSSA